MSKRVEMMLKKEKEKQERLELERLIKNEREVQSCTFKPKLFKNY